MATQVSSLQISLLAWPATSSILWAARMRSRLLQLPCRRRSGNAGTVCRLDVPGTHHEQTRTRKDITSRTDLLLQQLIYYQIPCPRLHLLFPQAARACRPCWQITSCTIPLRPDKSLEQQLRSRPVRYRIRLSGTKSIVVYQHTVLSIQEC